MDDDRQASAAQPGREAGEAGGVVEVAVTADDDLDVGEVLADAAQVLDTAVGRDPGVEQHRVPAVTAADGHQSREAVLRQRPRSQP